MLLAGAAAILPSPAVAATDWGAAVARSTIARNPNPDRLSWDYPTALGLLGIEQVYQRTRDPALLKYLKDWGNRHVASDGTPYMFGPLTTRVNLNYVLNYYLAGRLMLRLYKETGTPKYRLASDKLALAWPKLARTRDGAFWIANPLRANQVWLDGGYMLSPFMVEYQTAFQPGSPGLGEESAKQLRLIIDHLYNPGTGLLFHGYDESGGQWWADPVNHRSAEYWLRGNGWVAMALVDVLELLPAGNPDRPRLLEALVGMAAAIERTQDPTSHLWRQVIDKPSVSGNYRETSGSAMFVYALSRGVELGLLPEHYRTVAAAGYQGVLSQISLGTDGRANIRNTCTGAVPTNLAGYIARPRATNDWHGIGAFLLMYEQVN